MERRPGLNQTADIAAGKLPFDAKYFTSGDSGDFAQRNQRRFSEKSIERQQGRGREGSRRGTGGSGRRSQLGGRRNRAQPQSRKAMERFCGAIPATRAPGLAGGRVDAAKNSVRDQQFVDT